ncbi:MAG: aspartate aminotransferase family protein [Rhodothermales bacterium]|nr:aspartate aminotransferase family protein [Rhodothermales bacterium]MBO6778286.1 aspartate aminotransferase family protein [Rhodothermales bacterium]
MDPRFRDHVAWTSDAPLGLVVERAEGPLLHLADGRTVIDLISGIAVSSLGHRHPRVLQAIKAQLDRHLHVMVYGEFVQEPQSALAARLASHLPESLSTAYFTMTGTEANEGALKLAKKYTGRSRLVAFEHSYHGDTHGSLSVTGRRVYRDPFLPLLPEVIFLPFDDPEVLSVIDHKVAGVITEPIQGEGGVNVPSDAWMQALRERCTDAGALLIFDEIQTGMGRTGTLYAFQGFGVVPDILTTAKALGGGMPLGAFISSAEIMGSLRRDPPLSHVTTFGGHPVSCAAADAALTVLMEEGLPGRAVEVGNRVRKALQHPRVREVRGRGAMLGMELGDAALTEAVVIRCLEGGVLLGWTLHSNSLVRIAPPLNISWDVLDQALSVMRGALDQT